MILQPRPLSLSRWWRHSSIEFSLLRSLEYESIDGLRLEGLVLDAGGGERNSYVHLLVIPGSLETVNIDPLMQPTYVADLNEPLPIPSNRYDNVISLNTLEHIANDRCALHEFCRVLKPGGTAHIIVPYTYRIHEHGLTKDYHRHTATAWTQMLTEAGYAPDTIQIEPLTFGRLSSAFALAEFVFPKPIRWVLKRTVLLVNVLWHMRPGRSGVLDPSDMPLGYHLVARKVVS